MGRVETALAGLDEDTARTVRDVLGWMVPGGLERLSQQRLQSFLWYELPTKWSVEDVEHHEVAWALGDFLAAAGMGRYARVCRDPATHRILSAWHSDRRRGQEAMRAAEQRSGVAPPDTDLLTWGEVMGPHETALHAAASVTLEEATLDGRLDLDTKTWRSRARRLTAAFLDEAPRTGRGEVSLEAVRRERARAWFDEIGATRAGQWDDLVPALAGQHRVPDACTRALLPARRLLETVGEGVSLTRAGYLPPRLALELDRDFGWSEDTPWATRPRGESDIPRLRFLREHLRRNRLLTRRGSRLLVSAAGRRAREDPQLLWAAVTRAHEATRHTFTVHAQALVCALLLTYESLSSDDMDDEVALLLRHRWRSAGGRAVIRDDVFWPRVDWYRVGLTLEWWQRRSSPVRGLRMTEVGRAAALSLLGSVATAPRAAPSGR